MANKFKNINRKKAQKKQNDSALRTAMGLGAVAIVVLLIVFVFYGKNSQQNSPAPQQANDTVKMEQAVQTAEQAAAANPKDFSTLSNLGNAYYDLGFAYLQANDSAKTAEWFGKALDPYQKALAIKFDVGVQTDMATSAFYSNQPDIAEPAFKKAIEAQPDFFSARLNYGIFLQSKGDIAGAKEQLQYVAQKATGEQQSQAQQLLKSLQ